MSIDSTIDAPLANEVDRFVGRLGSALGEQWAPTTRKWVARAPGRLDVMGGFAEYTGSLTLSYALASAVLVALAPRDDQTVFVCALHHELGRPMLLAPGTVLRGRQSRGRPGEVCRHAGQLQL